MLRVLISCLVFAGSAAAQQASLPSLSQPALSPDGKEIAFVSGGNIWAVPAPGGEAHLLVADGGSASRPLYSPDGKGIAFVSTLTGNGDIYVLTFSTGKLQRLTYSDEPDALNAWSRDGEWIYLSNGSTNIGRLNSILRVRAAGGTPSVVSSERGVDEFEPAPSPDGTQLALLAKGISSVQWWRNGHAHIDNTELWLRPVSSGGAYRRLLPDDAKHAWPMWSADGKSLFYMSDRGGAENLFRVDAASGKEQELTAFKDGRVLWPNISQDGSTIVFERHFGIWRCDTATGKTSAVPITLRGAMAANTVQHLQLSRWGDLALSPDGKKIAVSGHGEIFAASAKDPGPAQRLTHTVSAESSPEWLSDSNRVVYASERDGNSDLYEYDFSTHKERPLTQGDHEDHAPTASPDGKRLAYLRGDKELHILTFEGMRDTVAAQGLLGSDALAWSPDSQWVAFGVQDANSFTNLHVAPVAGGPDRAITFLANGETAGRIAWSPDGKYILFDTAQRSEDSRIARVDLIPHLPSFQEDKFTELFEKQQTPGSPDKTTPSSVPETKPPADTEKKDTPTEDKTAPEITERATTKADSKTDKSKGDQTKSGDTKAKAAKKAPEPTKIVFEGLRERVTFLPLGVSASDPMISPDGKTLLFRAQAVGQSNLYTWSLDELSPEPPVAKQLTATPGRKGNYHFTPDSKSVIYLQSGPAAPEGIITITSIEAHMPKPLPVTAVMDVDFDEEKQVVFQELWQTLNQHFYDEHFHGRDWKALRTEWQPYIRGAQSESDLRRDLNLLIGELNASHSGTAMRPQPANRVGRLGLLFDRDALESRKGFLIRDVLPLGPADVTGSVHAGDRLLAINDMALTGSSNLDQVLTDTTGKRTVLSIAPGGDVSKKHDVTVLPVPTAVDAELLYAQWVQQRRAYVERISGGKLGYVHLAAMGDQDLERLYLTLDADNQTKKGVVIDIRNNNGGYVNGRVIDVFSRRNYMQLTPRGGSPQPSRQALGQRALGLPTVLVTNESTLSDGEDFTEGYRSLQLGKVVGTPTAGWIIFTGAHRLIDGSQVRMPGYRVLDSHGADMEMHPRPVDVEVEKPLGEDAAGEDIQLRRAVEELLKTAG